MVIVDANVLLYAVDRRSAHHEASLAWLDGALRGAETVALAWVVLLAFVRIGTHPSLLAHPMTVDEALSQVDAWLSSPVAIIAHPGVRHVEVLRSLLRESGTAGNLTTDAHLAALAVEHGAEIVSYDRDFARFAGVRHRLP
ncbi:MAG: type II toxin-antitoxin system VapC family toxin [Solirubrobacterales bacterium]